MKNLTTTIELLPFDFDVTDLKESTSIFYNLPTVVVDFDFQEMSGTDCAVAYLFKSKEEAEAKLGDLSHYMSLEDFDHVDFDHTEIEALYYPVYSLTHKSDLRPESAEVAKLLIESQRRQVERSIARNTKEMGERDEWLVMTHKPYMYEKLGKVVANCSKYL